MLVLFPPHVQDCLADERIAWHSSEGSYTVQERYPSVSGFTSIADNCFQV